MNGKIRADKGRHIIAKILILCLVLGMVPVSASASDVKDATIYYTGGQSVSGWYSLSPDSHTDAWYGMGADAVTNEPVWYALSADADNLASRTIQYSNDRPIRVYGEVNLVLSDDYTLSADAGIIVPQGATLNIYGGSYTPSIGNRGSLVSVGRDGSAGIGGTIQSEGGQINVYGGNITAQGDDGANGIGGGKDAASNGIMTVQTGLGIWGGANGSTSRLYQLGAGNSLDRNVVQRYSYMKVEPYTPPRTPSAPSSSSSSSSSSSNTESSTPANEGNSTTQASSAEKYTIPVENETTVNVEASISNGKAEISEITARDIAAATNASASDGNAAGADKTTIMIDLSGAKQKVTAVQLSLTSIERLEKAVASQENKVDTVTIKLTNATVALDVQALSALSKQAKGNTIQMVVDDTSKTKLNAAQQTSLSAFAQADTFEAYFESNGSRIHDFDGGKASVSIRFTPARGREAKYYHVYYVAESGELTRYATTYADGVLAFTTTHFSDYAIVYDTTMENETGKEQDNTSNDDTQTDSTTVMETDVTANGKTTYENAIALNKKLAVSQIESGLELTWGKVTGADRYEVFAQYCGSKFKSTPTKVTKKTTASIQKLNGKKLDLKRNYKLYVVAYKTVDGKKQKLGKTIAVHIVGQQNAVYSNPKKVTVKKSSYSLKVAKTAKIQAAVTLADENKKSLSDKHAPTFRYASSDKKIATVDKNGKIKAKSTGSCIVYVYARNGCSKAVKVTVKQ